MGHICLVGYSLLPLSYTELEDCIKDGHTTSFKLEDVIFNMSKDILMTCVNLLFNELSLFCFLPS